MNISSAKHRFLSKDRVIRGITGDGFFRITAIKTSDVVRIAQEKHQLSLSGAIMLGKALTGVMLLASDLKGEERVSLRIEGKGKLGNIIAEANRLGEIRGYVSHPQADICIETGEKPEDLVGNGLLSVSKTLFNEATPVVGVIAMTHGNISDDLADYLLYSEQIASALIIDVGITADGEIEEAGGILIQALPGASIEQIEQIEHNVQPLRSFSALLREGSLLDDLMRRALPDMFVKELLRCPVHFFCRCDKQRFTSALALLPLSDLLELRGQEQELRCHYCNQIYVISEQEIEEIWCEKGADDWKHSKPN